MKRSKIVVQPILLVATLAISLGTGCDKSGGDQAQAEAAQAAAAPKPQVSLPAPPNFQEARVQEKWEDGSYSIYGLRAQLDERVAEGDAGTEVMVKGYVQEVYVPPECPEGELCPPGKQPHFWITDKADQGGKKRAMMVVNYRFNIPEWDAKRWRKEPEVQIEVGKRYTIKGKFKRFSDTGFADDNGLFEFAAYKPLDEAGQELGEWRYPPGAPWHPMEEARAEEESQRLAEKAAKATEQYQKRKRK